jgi:hypothetical protein
VGESLRGRVATYVAGSAALVQRVSATTETAVENAEQPVLAEITDLAAEVAALRREAVKLLSLRMPSPRMPSSGAGGHPEARS